MSNSTGKLDYKKTLLLGFGFLASSLAWSLYNSLVPVLLEERFMLSTTIIGAIMTIDNVFGIIFQPLVGTFSDRTFTRYGRRMPWIMVGIPLSALFFFLIPWAKTLWLMMGFIVCFNLIMSFWRSPVIALMPDITPRPLRSKANGLINLMGGIGSIIAFLAGGYLAKLDGSGRLTFGMGSVIMVAALVCLILFVREPVADMWRRAQRESVTRRLTAKEFSETYLKDQEDAKEIKEMGGVDRKLTVGEKRSLILLLGAIFPLVLECSYCDNRNIVSFLSLFSRGDERAFLFSAHHLGNQLIRVKIRKQFLFGEFIAKTVRTHHVDDVFTRPSKEKIGIHILRRADALKQNIASGVSFRFFGCKNPLPHFVSHHRLIVRQLAQFLRNDIRSRVADVDDRVSLRSDQHRRQRRSHHKPSSCCELRDRLVAVIN
jgi:MFS family permease